MQWHTWCLEQWQWQWPKELKTNEIRLVLLWSEVYFIINNPKKCYVHKYSEHSIMKAFSSCIPCTCLHYVYYLNTLCDLEYQINNKTRVAIGNALKYLYFKWIECKYCLEPYIFFKVLSICTAFKLCFQMLKQYFNNVNRSKHFVIYFYIRKFIK